MRVRRATGFAGRRRCLAGHRGHQVGSRQFVEDLSTFVDNRNQKVFLQRIKLPRPRFKPNRRMELVVTVKRAEVGSLKFITDGEEKRNSGVVDFGAGE